jgi:hypothetical protein
VGIKVLKSREHSASRMSGVYKLSKNRKKLRGSDLSSDGADDVASCGDTDSILPTSPK